MKALTKITAALLCVIMLVPMTAFGYSSGAVENPAVDMPKASPVIDGDIAADGGCWSATAYVNEATCGHFWGGNPNTSSAEIFFAYDDDGLYFAADIVDNDESNGFVPATGYDNIDDDYGFNGDVMTLMLDPLGLFEKSSYQTTPWYNVGIFSSGKVRVFRSRVNDDDITDSVKASGAITDGGWKFEIFIPWSIISADVSSASGSSLSASEAKLAAVGSVSRAACMYMDRHYVNGSTTVDTWGRFITVCETTYDGYKGVITNGVSAKAYGITLNHTDLHEHEWDEWVVDTEPTCTTEGYQHTTCTTCGVEYSETIPVLGHDDLRTETKDATCTEEGYRKEICGICGEAASYEVYPALGHSWGDWTVATAVSDTQHGIDERVCTVCKAVDQKIIAANNAPAYTIDNFLVKFENADKINHIRYAGGVHTSLASIRNADDLVNINSTIIAENTTDNVYVRNMPTGGLYTFWVRLTDGTSYIVPVDISYMEQDVTSDGVIITVHNLYGVKDFFIAEGDYDSYREVADNQLTRISSEKIGKKHDYSYTVYNPGVHTVCIRYNDESRAHTILKVNLTVTEPTFSPNGLQLTVGNLDGVKVIRSAYGDHKSSHDIKVAEGCRNFTARNTIKGEDPYVIQYRENGLVSVCVEYTNGYVKVYQFEAKKKVPSVSVKGNTVTFGNLDDLYNIRYAPGVYTTSKDIKNAAGSKFVRPSAIVDGLIVISGLTEDATYTFCVQYKDESYNYYTIDINGTPSLDPADVLSVSDERQLMLEDFVIDANNTDAELIIPDPVKKNQVFSFNKSYESSDAVYHNIVTMPDGTYRMYYKATSDIRRICYIESKDGLNWTRPNLTTNLYNGAASNIVTNYSVRPDNLFVFYDTKPGIPENRRLKGVYGQWGDGLFFEFSTNGDGKDFQFWPNEQTLMTTPAKTEGAYFDTLNTVYWDNARGKYVAFVRGFHEGDNYNLTPNYVQSNGRKITRDIRVSYSTDGTNWTIPVPLVYDDGADWQMYANAIVPYYRASQLYVGMPTRYQWPEGTSLPMTDIFLMSSRDLLNWDRTETPYMTPGQVEGATWDYGDSGYPCVGYIQTGDREMSFYMKEKNSSGTPVLYRYTLRVDGFRMAYGDSTGKDLATKFMTFKGDELEVNYATTANGKMRVTMTNEFGVSIQSDWMSGDDIGAKVTFDGNLADFEGQNVTLKFELYDASLYSFKFN